jgi:thiamine biosynthesis lipoprotein
MSIHPQLTGAPPQPLRRARPLLGTLVQIAVGTYGALPRSVLPAPSSWSVEPIQPIEPGQSPGHAGATDSGGCADSGGDRDDDLGGGAAQLEAAIDAAFAAVEQVHRLMSFHDPDSDVSRLNRGASHAPVPVDPLTWDVLRIARRIGAASSGAFDITVAPWLVQLGYLPAPGDSPQPRAGRGHAAIALRRQYHVAFSEPLWIDLGGIAKGYAVDRACLALERAGVFDYVVNAGGDLRVGHAPAPIHVRHPGQPGAMLVLGQVGRAAVASSGDYFSAAAPAAGPPGQGRWHPIIAPAAAGPAPYAGSITVIAADCVIADALTKVVAVLGDQAAPVLRHFSARAILVSPQGVQHQLPDTLQVASAPT